MQKLLRAVQKEADAFDVLRLTNPMYAVTLKGRREWLGKITTCLSSVSGLGRTYVAPRASRAIMTSFGPIDPSEWHNQTWGDVRDIMVDAGGHLTDLFPPDTSASAIAALLPFPLEHLPMHICIVSNNLQQDIFDLQAAARDGIIDLSLSLSPHWKWPRRPSQSQPATPAPAQHPALAARTAATTPHETICLGPVAARAAILDKTTWDVPSATRAAITAFTVDRHNAMLHHVAQPTSYHPATLAWQSRFLSILAERRHATPSDASSAGVPYYSLKFPYQEHEWTSSMNILRRQLDHRIETGTTTIRDLVPTFLTSSYTDRNDSSMDAAYHIALGAKHTNQTSSTGAAIAAGCTRVTRRISQPADNGISAGYSVSFEHAFLEDVCCPAYRVFNTAISCTTHDALSRRSYAGRALLPCLERSTNECHDSFSKEKHTKRDHCLQLAIFLSVGILHSTPITITPRAVFSEHQSHDHDLLLSAASDLGRDVGPLSAAALLSSWDLTHATTVPTPLALILARPPCLFNLTFWAENPGAGAFYIWLLPIQKTFLS